MKGFYLNMCSHLQSINTCSHLFKKLFFKNLLLQLCKSIRSRSKTEVAFFKVGSLMMSFSEDKLFWHSLFPSSRWIWSRPADCILLVKYKQLLQSPLTQNTSWLEPSPFGIELGHDCTYASLHKTHCGILMFLSSPAHILIRNKTGRKKKTQFHLTTQLSDWPPFVRDKFVKLLATWGKTLLRNTTF